MRRLCTALAVLLAMLLPSAPAWAHNSLAESSPAAGATLTAAPGEVRLRFLQKLNPQFTTIVVSDAAKQRVPTGEPAVDGATGRVTISGALANGGYTVAYRTVSVDGHVVQGSYAFTVADPAARAAVASTSAAATSTVATSAAAAASSEPRDDGGLPGPVVIGLVAFGVILAGLAAALYRRGRRPGQLTRASHSRT
ncbi:copper resistance CopC family protein [Actinoplanes sp. NPDC026619]|uniref:copper resistance CopC family protein n=1 Tax=Actinoplanes sp. NPDC026619 TaxID=3155798 RepID=UPI0033FA21EC